MKLHLHNKSLHGLRYSGGASIAFTLLEIMLAIAIFSLVIGAMYSSWTAIIRGTAAAQATAADVQRERIAMRSIEDAFLSAQLFSTNAYFYYFEALNEGNFASISLAARLPESFPLGGVFVEDETLRRVTFYAEPLKKGGNQLIMRQTPLFVEEPTDEDYYEMVLTKNLSLFEIEFYDPLEDEWLVEWPDTNMLPVAVKISLGFTQPNSRSRKDETIAVRTIALPALTITPDMQVPRGGAASRNIRSRGGQTQRGRVGNRARDMVQPRRN